MDFMDLNSVYMVRSAKGVDMLCVDDYLYHYDGRGRANTYRWLCNRRKDKHAPCRSRITTVLSNPRDRSVHVVQEVSGKHTHPRCSDHEITKVSERKRLANLQGQPCTLDLKIKKRTASLPKSVHMVMESATPNKRPKFDDSSETSIKQKRSVFNSRLDFEDTERVYILRRLDGRIMCCVDGQLFYLDGKSTKMELYRWICVRKRDVSCTALIYTEPTIEGAHRLRTVESDAHIHPHYSPGKLIHMFDKHNISVLDDDQVQEALGSIVDLDLFENVQGLNESSEIYDHYEEDEESIIIEEYGGDDYQVIVDEDDNNTTTEVILQSISRKSPRGYDVVEHYVPPPDYDPLTETSLEKFSFLPSSKGKKVLCLDRNLFHYDAQSKANGYLFWSCILRRNNSINCHVRVTMDPTENGPVIIRTNGQHNHPMQIDDIRRRLKRQQKLNTEFYDDSQADNSYISGIDESDGSSTIDYTNISEHLNDFMTTPTTSVSGELRRMVQHVKKVIDIDGIKMEPIVDINEENAPMIVEFCNDGSANIEILPETLKREEDITKMDASKEFNSNDPNINSQQPKTEENEENEKNTSVSLSPQSASGLESDMDLTKICKLRSAKGSEMLCVDGYIYHAKNKGLISRSYWVCIKARDPDLNCKSRVSTATQKDGSIRVLRVYNRHSHPVNEADIKRRLYNEINKKANKKLKFKPLHFIEKSLDQINAEYGDLAIERLKVSNISQDVVVHKPLRVGGPREKSNTTDQQEQSTTMTTRYQQRQRRYQNELEEQHDQETEAALSIMEISTPLMEDQEQIIIEQDIDEDYAAIETIIPAEEDTIIEEVGEIVEYDSLLPVFSMKLYAVSDGPPSLAVRMTLRALQIQYQLINVDFCALEHHSEDYAKMNPQKEIPVLEDDGFFLSESIAIMQYLCDKYAPDSTLYPQDANARAVINQRLCFNMGFYYAPISAHSMAPIFFDYKRTPMSLKKVQNALDVFETYLHRTGSKYAASDELTIADFGLVSATLCLEAIDFDLTQYPLVYTWYNTFKGEYPELWDIANSGMQEIKEFEKNPPDLSHMNHPFHPTKKASS